MNRVKKQHTTASLILRENFKALAHLPQLISLLWSINSKMLLGNIVLRVVRAALPLTVLYIGRKIIDTVISLKGHQSHDIQILWELLALEFVLVILMDVLNRQIALLDDLLGDLFSINSSVMVVKHAATLDLEQFEDPVFFDKLEHIRQQSKDRTDLMLNLLNIIQDIITVMFLSAGLLTFNPWLILLFPVSIIPSFFGESYFNGKTYQLFLSEISARREVEYFRNLGTNDASAKEIRIFDLADLIADKLKKLSDKFYQDNKQLSIRHSVWGILLAFLGNVSFYLVYVFILIKAIQGRITIGELAFLAASFRQMRVLLDTTLVRFAIISQGSVYIRDFFGFFKTSPSIISPQAPLPFPMPLISGIQFDNVGFRYANSDKWAVRHISFHIGPGQKLAFVGENGSGKTTIVKLMSRLYDPTEGRILVDGIDVKAYDLKELRMNIGIIFQDFVRYQMTMEMNIAVGNIACKEDTERVMSAAEKSQADSLAAKLSYGYQQMLGKRFFQGVELSGGEWQKIALARAYMRDSQLLILDEPTSALDARAEYEVFKRFAELSANRSAVFISHRFSTVRQAHLILVLQNGRILETGNHQQLLTLGGKYAELFRLQSIGYQ